MQEVEGLIVDEEVRLDLFLSRHYKQFSRTYFQYLIADGFVLLDGKQVKKRVIPTLGQEVEICFQLTPELSLEPEAIELSILYEDDDLLAINKPAGMVVHPAPGHPTGTFVNALLYHCKLKPSNDSMRPGIVHRLDKDTSGVLIAAKNSLAHQKLTEMFAERKIKKSYLAICMGHPKAQTISAPIARHPIRRKEMSVQPSGKKALTQIEILKSNHVMSFLSLFPETGRTHQLRVHLKHIGSPIYADPIYGKKVLGQRLHLHAHELKFLHPITHKEVHIKAPLADDIKKTLDTLS
jgi:23S rRNA pseudouridine1911/1915/1917 synthase